jgi:hypothetical protein
MWKRFVQVIVIAVLSFGLLMGPALGRPTVLAEDSGGGMTPCALMGGRSGG